jgi:hypothetical protein
MRLAWSEGVSEPSAEMQFTTKRINSNFSDYSAWHHRSVLLDEEMVSSPLQSLALTDSTPSSAEEVENEFIKISAGMKLVDAQSEWKLIGGKLIILTVQIITLTLRTQLCKNCVFC